MARVLIAMECMLFGVCMLWMAIGALRTGWTIGQGVKAVQRSASPLRFAFYTLGRLMIGIVSILCGAGVLASVWTGSRVETAEWILVALGGVFSIFVLLYVALMAPHRPRS